MALSHPSTNAQQAIGEFAPKLAQLTDQVLFDDVWERAGLSKRDRSLATISTLIALRATEQLPFHLKRGLESGLTEQEIVELITHLAFYAGWPAAMSALTTARTLISSERP